MQERTASAAVTTGGLFNRFLQLSQTTAAAARSSTPQAGSKSAASAATKVSPELTRFATGLHGIISREVATLDGKTAAAAAGGGNRRKGTGASGARRPPTAGSKAGGGRRKRGTDGAVSGSEEIVVVVMSDDEEGEGERRETDGSRQCQLSINHTVACSMF